MNDDFPTPVNVATLGGHFKPTAEKTYSEEALNVLRSGPNQMGPGINKKAKGGAAEAQPVVKL